MSKNISWLQLSDLHIFKSTEWNIMLKGYEELSKKVNPNFIVLTGDYRHKNCEYNIDYSKTLDFLNKIVGIFNVKKKDVFLVPGNHDIENYSFRKETINTIVQNIESNPDAYMEYLVEETNLKKAFETYNNFIKKFYSNEVSDGRSLSPDDVMNVIWDDKINIIILNTSLISDGNKNHKEIIDVNKLSSIKIQDDLPTIVLGHHDFYSIYKSQQKQMVKIFEYLNVKAYLCGDKHKEEIKTISKYNIVNESIPCIVCGKSAVQPTDNYSDVGVIEYIWKNDGNVYVKPYKWENNSFAISNDFIFDIDKDYFFSMSYPSVKKQPINTKNNQNEYKKTLSYDSNIKLQSEYTSVFAEKGSINNEIIEISNLGDGKVEGRVYLDKNNVYKLCGTFKNHILTGEFMSVGDYTDERGTINLKLISKDILSGFCSFSKISNVAYDQIRMSPYVWIAGKNNDLINGTYEFCTQCHKENKKCCCASPDIDMPVLLKNEAQKIQHINPRHFKIREFSHNVGRTPIRQVNEIYDEERGNCCYFYNRDKNQCTIYNIRPTDCRLFPFDIKLDPYTNEYWIGYYSDLCDRQLPDQEVMKQYAHILRPQLFLMFPYANTINDKNVCKHLCEASFEKLYKLEEFIF